MGFLDDPRRREASDLAFLADRLRSAGDESGARKHYARAAVLEVELLAALKPEERALHSTLAVSAVALWFRAKDARKLDELATRLLAGDGLTPGARAEIAEMRDEALADERDRVRRHLVTTTFALADNFRLLIEAALHEGGSYARAAEILGITPHALRRKIKKYGVVRDADEPSRVPRAMGARRDA